MRRRGQRARRQRAATTAGLIVLALLAACTGGGGNGGDTNPDNTKDARGRPQRGGKVIMATEAETVTSLDPTKQLFDLTALTYADTVFDTLAAYGKDGRVHPYLAESITGSPDHRTWTIKVRPGVKFHDGESLTADDVKTNLDRHRASPLTSPLVAPIDAIDKVDDLTIAVRMSEPWPSFPAHLTGQVGYVVSPKTLADPSSGRSPIGTGPFSIRAWTPDSFTAVKNPAYWQKGLPYLDEVEYRPTPDAAARAAGLRAATVDLLHTADPATIVDLRKDKAFKLFDDSKTPGEHEELFFLLNTAKPPLDDVRLRRALALATDRRRILDTVYAGVLAPSSGPFDQHSPHHADTGYPDFNLDEARRLVAEVRREKGRIAVELASTIDPKDVKATELAQSMWKEAGIEVTVRQTNLANLRLNALVGNHSVYLWRQFGTPDPDLDFASWHSAAARAPGAPSLNLARIKDPEIDAALTTARQSTDANERTAAYQTVARRLAQELPYLWIGTTVWAVAAKPRVNGVMTWKLPDGADGLDRLSAGRFLISHVWVTRR